MRKLIILLVVLLGFAVVVDFGAAAYANHATQAAVKNTANLGPDPSVRIHGFPFLTQAVLGEFSDIEIHASHVGSGNFGDLDVEANLRGVHVSFGDLVSRNLSRIPVDRVDTRVRFPASRPLALLDVVALLPFGLTPTDIGFDDGQILVTGVASDLVLDLDSLKE